MSSEFSSAAESKDEVRDRWLFNLGVFFLLIPFTLLIGYMTGSLIGIGCGVALAVWRLSATPEITSHFSLRVSGRPRQFLRDVVIGLEGGFTLLGITDFASQDTATNGQFGYPLSYAQPVPSCFGPGWPFGCPTAYSPAFLILDYLFWAVVAFAFAHVLHVAWIRFVQYQAVNQDARAITA